VVLCSSLLCARRRCRILSAQTSLIASLRRVARLIVLNELVERLPALLLAYFSWEVAKKSFSRRSLGRGGGPRSGHAP
jgi:hypothetical protein